MPPRLIRQVALFTLLDAAVYLGVARLGGGEDLRLGIYTVPVCTLALLAALVADARGARAGAPPLVWFWRVLWSFVVLAGVGFVIYPWLSLAFSAPALIVAACDGCWAIWLVYRPRPP